MPQGLISLLCLFGVVLGGYVLVWAVATYTIRAWQALFDKDDPYD